jgi:hypothetical protein
MYFLVKLLQANYTVVYESVIQKRTWIFGKNRNCLIKRIISEEDVPEFEEKNTVHLFDAKAGIDSYEITRIEKGAIQVNFSSTNKKSYSQYIRFSDVYPALFPSLSKEEFSLYVDKLNVSPEIVQEYPT